MLVDEFDAVSLPLSFLSLLRPFFGRLMRIMMWNKITGNGFSGLLVVVK
jgi:hypothetical protein